MNKQSFTILRYAILIIIAFPLILSNLISCGEDTVNAPQDFVSGTITYLDTNVTRTGGYFAIGLYGDSTSPFNHQPIRKDSLSIAKSGNTATAYYKLEGIASGNYYIASIWVNSSSGSITVLGVYGCDENINCSNPTKETVPNYAGTGNLNFKSLTH